MNGVAPQDHSTGGEEAALESWAREVRGDLGVAWTDLAGKTRCDDETFLAYLRQVFAKYD